MISGETIDTADKEFTTWIGLVFRGIVHSRDVNDLDLVNWLRGTNRSRSSGVEGEGLGAGSGGFSHAVAVENVQSCNTF